VAVIIPCYDEESTIGRKLIDVYDNCSYESNLRKIYVIDDHSHDDTFQTALRFKIDRNLDNLFVWRSESTEGKAAALNWAFPRISEDVFAITDADTLWSKNALEELVSDLADPSVGAATARLAIANAQGGFGAEVLYRKKFDELMKAESNIDSCAGFNGQLMVLKKEVAKRLRISERTYADDVDLLFKVRIMGFRVIYEPNAEIREFAPTNWWEVFKQKVRRSRGITQILLGNLDVLGRYGRFGRLIYPLRLYTHVVSPVINVVLLILLSILGIIYPLVFLGALLLCISPMRVLVAEYLVSQFALLFGLLVPRRGRWRSQKAIGSTAAEPALSSLRSGRND